jgi:ATP-dependent Clp protease ATP-binding subunit ClpA
MFERFTTGARELVVGAQAEARALGHSWIGTEHLLLSAVADPDSPVTRTLAAIGLSHDAVRAQVVSEIDDQGDDEAALRDLGIDLGEVRRRVEERFGPDALERAGEHVGGGSWWRRRKAARLASGGHIPFTRAARKALELSLREALAVGSKEIRVEHIVLGTMRADAMAAKVAARLGAAPKDVRRVVLDRLGKAA